MVFFWICSRFNTWLFAASSTQAAT